jgi:hypothetical protein
MKILLLVVALAFGGIQLAFATTTDELRIESNGAIATITDNGACVNTVGTPCAGLTGDVALANGTVSVNGSLNGWTISSITGSSHSPSLSPNGMDVSSLTASCTIAGGCTGANSLEVIFSDINYNVPVPAGGFTVTVTDNQSGPGTVMTKGAFDNGNTIFLETTPIGTVTLNGTTNPGSASGGAIAAVPNYSLTLDSLFSGSDNTQFSVDSRVTAVPEPATVALLGAALLLCSSRLRRKRA